MTFTDRAVLHPERRVAVNFTRGRQRAIRVDRVRARRVALTEALQRRRAYRRLHYGLAECAGGRLERRTDRASSW